MDAAALGKSVLGPRGCGSWATRRFSGVFGLFWGGEVFFGSDARRACCGATFHTPRSDFRVASQAMVGVGFGV